MVEKPNWSIRAIAALSRAYCVQFYKFLIFESNWQNRYYSEFVAEMCPSFICYRKVEEIMIALCLVVFIGRV